MINIMLQRVHCANLFHPHSLSLSLSHVRVRARTHAHFHLIMSYLLSFVNCEFVSSFDAKGSDVTEGSLCQCI